jgi:lysophospholipid acyltransferase (LPLAT)-like uncharacterized protein
MAWHRRWAAGAIYLLIRGVAASLRCRWDYHPAVLDHPPRPAIFCVWHNRLALSLLMYRHYARQARQEHRLAALVSASRDGGIAARILELFGVKPVRGSTSRRGPQALLELTTWAAQGYDLAITPDGPRGPRYVVQPGVVALAQVTGRPIVPAAYHLRWKFCLRSWDRFQVPLPFGRVEMRFGEPFPVPREATEGEREQARLELQRRLLELTED